MSQGISVTSVKAVLIEGQPEWYEVGIDANGTSTFRADSYPMTIGASPSSYVFEVASGRWAGKWCSVNAREIRAVMYG